MFSIYQFFDSPEMWRKIPLLHSKIPKAFQFSCLEKNKECFGKPDKFRKFSLALFFEFDLVFPQLEGKGG